MPLLADLARTPDDRAILEFMAASSAVGRVFVLPPDVPAERVQAIRRAFSHVGKPYDFRFDFETDDELVCSELCWRALDGVIQVPLVKRAGSFTLIPDELAALATGPKAQLDLVEFVKDGKDAGKAEFEAVLK